MDRAARSPFHKKRVTSGSVRGAPIALAHCAATRQQSYAVRHTAKCAEAEVLVLLSILWAHAAMCAGDYYYYYLLLLLLLLLLIYISHGGCRHVSCVWGFVCLFGSLFPVLRPTITRAGGLQGRGVPSLIARQGSAWLSLHSRLGGIPPSVFRFTKTGAEEFFLFEKTTLACVVELWCPLRP